MPAPIHRRPEVLRWTALAGIAFRGGLVVLSSGLVLLLSGLARIEGLP